MKLTKNEFQRTMAKSEYQLFLAGIRAIATKEKYVRTLRKVLCEFLEDFFKGDIEDRCAQLVKHGKENPEWTRDLLIQLSEKLKERTKLTKNDPNYLNPSSFRNYFKPIKKLFDMNGVAIPWNLLYCTFPEDDNLLDTRGWDRNEIKEMLKFASGTMDRAIILIASSSGIRQGGFDFKWGDVTPIYKIGEELKMEVTESEENISEIVCAMIRIYKGTKESYPAFITPEAYYTVMDYRRDWIRQVGRIPKPEDPLFKREGVVLQRATPSSIKKRIDRMIMKSNIRRPLKNGERRYEVPIMNGFRRFWNKTCKEALSNDSPLASLIKKEYMMGHRGLVALDRNYFKTHMLELAEEYLNAVPELTISEEERTKIENRRLRTKMQKKNDELHMMKKDMEMIKKRLNLSR